MTNEELLKLIEELQAKVKELEAWKANKERQQISFPLDQASKRIISNI